jgi:4a-hydroxytetrahydrobiopterin dehydratase
MRKKLDHDEIAQRVASLPGWKAENEKLLRAFSFPDFKSALDFVNRVGAAAEEMGHHPDIQLGWGRAAFEISTHDAGGLTDHDFELARRIDAIAGALK